MAAITLNDKNKNVSMPGLTYKVDSYEKYLTGEDAYEQFLAGEDAYEQFLAGAEEYAQGVKDTTYAANAAARASAEKNAEKERQRAIVDADASYQKNVSDYGANAERLASMGLTNSGYADYQKSQSYAQMRGEVQNANAQSDHAKRIAAEQEAAGNREADLKYADYVNTAEGKLAEYKQGKADKLAEYKQGKADKLAEYKQGKTDQLTAAADTLLAAASAVTSAEELEALIERANNAGLSQDVINNIKSVGDSAVVKYGEETVKTAYYDILDAIDKGASLGEVEIMMKDAGITESSDYYTSLTGKVRDRDMQERSDGYASDIETNGVFADIHSILNDKNNGLIGQEEYNKLVKDWNAIAETELEAILANLNAGAVYDQRELKSLLEHISSAPMTPNVSSLYFKVNQYYQEKYGSASDANATSETAGDEPSYMSYIPKTNDGVKAINIDSAELANEGDWFTIKVEDNSKWVKSGGLAEEEDVNKAAKDLSDNTVFLYDGEIYIKYGNKVYSVKARDSFGGDYDDVYDTLKTGNYNLSTVETIKGIGKIGKSIKSNIVKNIWNKLTGK